jgi:hypothetical protein
MGSPQKFAPIDMSPREGQPGLDGAAHGSGLWHDSQVTCLRMVNGVPQSREEPDLELGRRLRGLGVLEQYNRPQFFTEMNIPRPLSEVNTAEVIHAATHDQELEAALTDLNLRFLQVNRLAYLGEMGREDYIASFTNALVADAVSREKLTTILKFFSMEQMCDSGPGLLLGSFVFGLAAGFYETAVRGSNNPILLRVNCLSGVWGRYKYRIYG